MGSPLILLLCLLSIIIQFTSGYLISLPNKTELALGWKFSKEHPYHYFPSVYEIPHNYLPIQVSSLNDRQGVWVLRHKEFSGSPAVFVDSHAAHQSASIITGGLSAQLFEKVTIKILAYGTVQFRVSFTQNLEQSLSILEPGNLEKCTGSVVDHDGPPKWMTFKIETPPTSHIKLEAEIRHAHAFLIIDEVIIDFGEGVSKNYHEDNIKTIKDINVSCAINLAN